MKIRGMTVFLIVIVVILLIVAVIANINTFKQLGWFGGSKPKQDRVEAKKPETNSPPAERTAPPEKEKPVKADSNESKNSNWRASLAAGQYGRTNPFQPLRGSSSRASTQTTRPSGQELEEAVKKAAPGPLMQVTAILGGQAIIKVDGASKTVSAGDTLAGMEVVSIEENGVVLRKEDKDYTITLGEEPKRIPPGEAE